MLAGQFFDARQGLSARSFGNLLMLGARYSAL
jgi:hypothetical protein